MAVNNQVLEVFQRFDSDADGSISRDELQEVLQKLSPEDWDKNAIDCLLAGADASGDGNLQVEEFVKWVFAEDTASFSLGRAFANAGLVILVSGCRRDELNGEYVQQADFYGRRPVFYNSSQKRFLFYSLPHGRWQIFGRKSRKSSARIVTPRAVHLADDAWAVWSGGKWNKEPEMKATFPPPLTTDQKLARAAEAVYVRSKWGNVTGGYRKMDRSNFERPAYYNKDDDTYLLYNGREGIWVVSSSFSTRSWLVSSLFTDVFSPDLTAWKGTTTVMAVDPNGNPCPDVQEGFCDEEFPHDDHSLGKSKKCEWIRACALRPCPTLFTDIEPADICQGALGDCWLIAAIAGVAEFPAFVKDHLFQTQDIDMGGKYEIKLYNWVETRWDIIVIDDYIPCKPRRWYEPTAVPIFAESSNDQLYVVLLEKAFAKFAGSYGELSGGFSALAWVAMTGEMEIIKWKRDRHVAKWKVTGSKGLVVRDGEYLSSTKIGRLASGAHFEELDKSGYRVKFRKLDGEGPDEGWLSCCVGGYRVAKCTDPVEWKRQKITYNTSKIDFGKMYSAPTSEHLDEDGMWRKVCEYDKANYLIGCSIGGSVVEKERTDGLIERHAYSVIHAVEVCGFKLVCCRNPWGNSKEWNGPWSDQSDEWTANKEVAQALNVDEKSDGIFWMEWEDFQRTWTRLEVCPKAMPSERAGFVDVDAS
eukprot:TRINITY_DN56799_c0_g1_i1.p1 TRINITY_DN56799_c0_g1~~TRINITY_DN56799_c0_g1_i1.p1  ORF type:complete len:699 (-),score=119.91 TRINITY_DN56799_c0_g1_i1:356-2452(-)